jgi:hypothetical protein
VRGRSRALIEGVPGEHRGVLDALAGEIAELLGGAPLPRDEATERAGSEAMEQGITAAILITLGVLWTSVGYVTMPDVLLTQHGAAFGLLAWPAGIIALVAGVLELARGRLARRGRTMPRGMRATVLALSVVLYVAFSLRA